MPIRAIEFVRKLRGGAQAHLMKAEDGHYYAVKFQNNPQGRRVLVNEWIAHAIFEQLRISTAKVAAIELTEAFLAANPLVRIEVGTSVYAPGPGWHFGSRLADDPTRVGFMIISPTNCSKASSTFLTSSARSCLTAGSATSMPAKPSSFAPK